MLAFSKIFFIIFVHSFTFCDIVCNIFKGHRTENNKLAFIVLTVLVLNSCLPLFLFYFYVASLIVICYYYCLQLLFLFSVIFILSLKCKILNKIKCKYCKNNLNIYTIFSHTATNVFLFSPVPSFSLSLFVFHFMNNNKNHHFSQITNNDKNSLNSSTFTQTNTQTKRIAGWLAD